MISIIRYILLTAARDFLFIGVLMAFVMAAAIAYFLGGTALVEQEQMTLSFMAGSGRMIIVVGLILFICFHIRRSFENKEIDVMLSRPISRLQFVIAYYIGFAMLGLFLLVPLFAALYGFTQAECMGLAMWSFSQTLETLMIVAFTLAAAMILRSAVSAAMLSLGFYFVARLMGFCVGVIKYHGDMPTVERLPMWLSEAILTCLSTVIPRLDLFSQTNWLVYGIADLDSLWIFPIQAAIYIPLLLVMAYWDVARKQF
jgi:ABC-type transport system involved in multi-copper enzyme maturation permease subunit